MKYKKRRVDNGSGYEFWEGAFGLVNYRKFDDTKPDLPYTTIRAIANLMFNRVVLLRDYGDYLQ